MTIVRCNDKRVKCDCLVAQKKALARAWKKQFIKVHTLKNKKNDKVLKTSENKIKPSLKIKFQKRISMKMKLQLCQSLKKMIVRIEIVQLTKIKFFITLMQMKIQLSQCLKIVTVMMEIAL